VLDGRHIHDLVVDHGLRGHELSLDLNRSVSWDLFLPPNSFFAKLWSGIQMAIGVLVLVLLEGCRVHLGARAQTCSTASFADCLVEEIAGGLGFGLAASIAAGRLAGASASALARAPNWLWPVRSRTGRRRLLCPQAVEGCYSSRVGSAFEETSWGFGNVNPALCFGVCHSRGNRKKFLHVFVNFI